MINTNAPHRLATVFTTSSVLEGEAVVLRADYRIVNGLITEEDFYSTVWEIGNGTDMSTNGDCDIYKAVVSNVVAQLVVTAPTKIRYLEGDELDTTGIP